MKTIPWFAVITGFYLIAVSPVQAGCDPEGPPDKFRLQDSWEVKDQEFLGVAKFSAACDELLVCYGDASKPKTICDRIFARSIKQECRKTFHLHADALNACERKTDKSVEFVEKENDAVYRKGQRLARANEREAERKQRAADRKTRADERRKHRAAYQRTLEPKAE
ncbi:MAG: hypothetical protein O3C28_16395 [Proteobacteria bacterium]|nr:hypothetical protein [Pseudomonadota bacterium]